MTTPHILVMMSTFNGGQFLREQVDSIFSQNNVKVTLLVRDDGSTDDTTDIIEGYRKNNPSSIRLIKGNNIGWRASFFELLSLADHEFPDYEYLAFADQDDIWLPDKLSRAVEALSTLPFGPGLYCSNLIYYKNGQQMGLVRASMRDNGPKGALIRNYATGCTIVFNRPLLSLLTKQRPHQTMEHDYWAFLTASLCGHVFVDSNAYILYRQHENNQIGSQRSWIDLWRRRLKSVSSLLATRDKVMVAEDLLRIHGQSMSIEGKEAAKKLATYRDSIKNRLSLFLDRDYTTDSLSNDFWLRMRIALGKL